MPFQKIHGQADTISAFELNNWGSIKSRKFNSNSHRTLTSTGFFSDTSEVKSLSGLNIGYLTSEGVDLIHQILIGINRSDNLCSANSNQSLVFENCHFLFNPNFRLTLKCQAVDKHFPFMLFKKSRLNISAVILDDFEGDLLFQQSSLNTVSIDRTSSSKIGFEASSLKQFRLGNSDNVKLEFYGNELTEDTAIIQIEQTKLSQTIFRYNKIQNLAIEFISDTINGEIFFENFIAQNSNDSGNIRISFYNCYINAPITFESSHHCSLMFLGCTFGPLSSSIYAPVDTVEFNRCILPEDGLSLYNPAMLNRKTVLKLEFTKVDRLNLFYYNQYKLFDYGELMEEITNSNYENLLSKFKNENKTESYEYLYIEYSRYKHTGFYNFFNELWWDYGFEKERIWIWTFILFGIFYTINMGIYEQLHKAYPIISPITHTYYDRSKKRLRLVRRELVIIFSFTVFIFFSIRIDFSKLNFNRSRIAIYILIQYLSGLICLFFILNSVIKLP